MQNENTNAIARISSCENLLTQHRSIHLLSCCLTAAATLALLFVLIMNNIAVFWLGTSILMIVLGVFETVLAVRIGFDAALLRQLGNRQSFSSKDLNELDQALMQLKLLPARKAGRPLEERLNGCLTLFKQQIWVCSLQLVTLASATAIILVKAW